MSTRAVPAAPRIPLAIPIGIGGAWLVAVALWATGQSDLLRHDAIDTRGLPVAAAFALFLAGWPLMLAAMMLPTTVPLLRLFAIPAARQERRGRVMAAFVGGYAAVWTVFGVAAFFGDLGLHHLVHAVPSLDDRPWLVSGAVLVGAGAFQFSKLKDACLTQCRHPAAWLLQHYRRGTVNAFRIGRDHGLYCLGCCAALMLLMFAAGVANVVWMGALAALMAYEKIGRRGEAAATIAGVVLLVWGGLVLVQPAWLPHVLAGVE